VSHLFVDTNSNRLHCFSDGAAYAGEIHFVHKNTLTGQLAVLAVFIESKRNGINTTMFPSINNTDTLSEWKRYINVAEQLVRKNQSTFLTLNLTALIGQQTHNFWRYDGSLTTPPCNQIVAWTVYRTSIQMTDNDINRLRTNLFTKNNRLPLPVYDRIVYRSFIENIDSLNREYECCSATTVNWIDRWNILVCLFSFYAFIFQQ
jgi:carbonic anhydrase